MYINPTIPVGAYTLTDNMRNADYYDAQCNNYWHLLEELLSNFSFILSAFVFVIVLIVIKYIYARYKSITVPISDGNYGDVDADADGRIPTDSTRLIDRGGNRDKSSSNGRGSNVQMIKVQTPSSYQHNDTAV